MMIMVVYSFQPTLLSATTAAVDVWGYFTPSAEELGKSSCCGLYQAKKSIRGQAIDMNLPFPSFLFPMCFSFNG